jgi:hypothetical protein
MGIGGFLTEDIGVWGVKLNTHLHLVPRSRILELYLHSPKSIHGVVFN